MITEYYPQYCYHERAVLSPCVAKKESSGKLVWVTIILLINQ